MDYFQESSLPKDLSAAAQLCCNALGNSKTKPVVVIIDAVNQVSICSLCSLLRATSLFYILYKIAIRSFTEGA